MSTCIAERAAGTPQRGTVHSVFHAAANILLPENFLLSLNVSPSARMSTCMPGGMPNGLQLSVADGAFPFSALRVGMSVLFGASCLHIEAINWSIDLSQSLHWNPFIARPEQVDWQVIAKNKQWLIWFVDAGKPGRIRRGKEWGRGGAGALCLPAWGMHEIWGNYETDGDAGKYKAPSSTPLNPLPLRIPGSFPTSTDMARSLCGCGPGLTPTGDDILLGWMAANWLLHGPQPWLLEACQEILMVARQQTHLLSQCWLGYAAQGAVAQPIKALLNALIQEDEQVLASAAETVLAMGATSGHDVIVGIVAAL